MDLPVVLELVRQHRVESHAEEVLTGHPPVHAAGAGFRRLLEDPGHRVVLAVLPAPTAAPRRAWAWRCSAWTRCPSCSGRRRSRWTPSWCTASTGRSGVGAALLAASAAYAAENGASYVVAAVPQEADRQRFFARMGFAPLTTRRIASVHTLGRSLVGLAAPPAGHRPAAAAGAGVGRRRGLPPLPSATAGR